MKKKPKQKAGAPAFAPMMPGGLRSAIQEAERLWKRGAMQDAIALVVDATNDFPDRIEGFRALWEFAAGSGDRFAAVLGAEGMLRLQPDDSESIFIAAQAYEEAGLVFHAWKHMVRLLDEHRDKFDPSMQDGVDLNRKMIRETALERFGGTDAEQAIEYGLLEEVGQLEQVRGNEYAARQAVLKLVAAVPDYAPAHQELAEIHFHAGEDEPALSEIDKAIALDPTRADYHATKVEMLHSLGSEDDALAAAQPLKTLTLRDPFEARFVGLALWLVGEEEALIDLPARTPPPDDDDDEAVKVAYSDVHHIAATAASADGRPEEEVEALLAKATYEPSDVLQSMEESTDWDEDFDEDDEEGEDDEA